MTRVGRLLKSGTGSLVLCAIVLALPRFSSQEQSGSLAQIWNRLTCSVRNCFGIAPVFFSGAGWAQGSLGFLPKRRKLKVVMGKPMEFPKVEKASTEEVDAAHKQYMAALASLYLKHNTDENVSLVIT